MPGAAPPVRQAEAQAAGFDIPAQTSTLHSVSKVCLHTHSYTLIIKSSPWIWNSPLGYDRVYLPLYKVADTPFHNHGEEIESATSL